MSAPCRLCGVATDRAVETVEKQSPSGLRGGPAYEVGTCAECEGLLPAEPGAAVRAALRVLGKDEGDWRLAAEAFDKEGIDAAYVLHDAAARNGRAAQRKPWGHVEKALKADLRAAYVKVLDAKVHRAAGCGRRAPAAAPPGHGPRGCLLCGVGVSAAWRSVTTGALTRGPGLVSGHLCATCSEVHDEVGAIGATLVERAALSHAGVPWSEEMTAPGLKPWVATSLEPGEPWAWVGGFRLPEPPPTVEDLAAKVAALAAAVAALEARLP
ncbi:hypothetical protein [Nocardioides ochotonae]|uniref:hypothetical protein n=1 Tax=Nocardioides ochotonae TaxID=2685869 RepID=UPI00140A8B49|nr:hypothetical protein [Nocardioides ochotonae]